VLYEFLCECGEEYEELAKFDETGEYPTVLCPKCNSSKKERLMSVTSEPVFIHPEGTRKWINESTGHDYRYKYKQPQVAQERKVTEELSHMGKSPYNTVDDISSGKHFGPVQ
jgi:putative FmdB family regulatory protein